jgi:hypothetical protein
MIISRRTTCQSAMCKATAFVSVTALLGGCAARGPAGIGVPAASRSRVESRTEASRTGESEARRLWLKVGDSFVELAGTSVVYIDASGMTMVFRRGSGPGDAPFYQARTTVGVKEQLRSRGWILLKPSDTTSPDPVGTVLFVNPALIVQIAPQPTPALPEGDALAVYVESVQRPVGLAFGDSINALMRLVGQK